METNCQHCGASLRKYAHTITPGLVRGLIKFRHAIYLKNQNRIHLLQDMIGSMKLEPHEWNNWTKLRFHALVAKVKEDGVHDTGYWLLTRRGGEFLNGKTAIPKKVWTYRNKVVGHSEETVYIKDVIGEQPTFEAIGDIESALPTAEDIEKVTETIKQKSKKKVKNPCPKCGTAMRFNLITEYQGNVAKIVKKNLKCPKCGEEDFIL